MSLIGSNAESGLQVAPRSNHAVTPRGVAGSGRLGRIGQPQVWQARVEIQDELPLAAGREAVAKTAAWLLGRQASDGHWRGPLEGDTILESEYIIIIAWAGRL